MNNEPIEHVAGPMVDWVQLCTRCGHVLSDYRNCAWPADQGPPLGYEEGVRVRVTAGCSSTVSGPSDAMPCQP